MKKIQNDNDDNNKEEFGNWYMPLSSSPLAISPRSLRSPFLAPF